MSVHKPPHPNPNPKIKTPALLLVLYLILFYWVGTGKQSGDNEEMKNFPDVVASTCRQRNKVFSLKKKCERKK